MALRSLQLGEGRLGNGIPYRTAGCVMENSLLIRYDGRDADSHQLNMRLLGESLIGFERLVTLGFQAVETGELPRSRTPLAFDVKVASTDAHCFEITALLGRAQAALPLIHDLYITRASDMMWHWVTGAIFRMSGRDGE